MTWSGFGIFKQNWDSWTVCDSIQYYQKKGRRQFILLRHSLECVVPENIQTPTTEGIGNSRGVGGSEAQEIPEGRGVGP